jgi:FixJ family two-component response regulator
MPRLSGTKAFEQMRALRPELPVLFITGYNPDMIGTSLTQQAGVQVLQKPFTMGDLGAMVREGLGRGSVKRGA